MQIEQRSQKSLPSPFHALYPPCPQVTTERMLQTPQGYAVPSQEGPVDQMSEIARVKGSAL